MAGRKKHSAEDVVRPDELAASGKTNEEIACRGHEMSLNCAWRSKCTVASCDGKTGAATSFGYLGYLGYLGGQFRFLPPNSWRKNENTLSASRKIDAAMSGAESRSVDRRSRWKSTMVRPAKMTRPRIE
jgi:hypothetical protein